MNKIYCSNCGQLIAGDAKFCTYCGVQQHGVEARFRAQDESRCQTLQVVVLLQVT